MILADAETLTDTEAEVLRKLTPELQAQGYDVYFRPGKIVLPVFFKDYSPTVLAIRTRANAISDKNLAIEIVHQSNSVKKPVEALRTALEGRTDWELRLIVINPASISEAPRIQSQATIQKRLEEIDSLVADGHFGSALLLAWAVFEAVSRGLMADQFQRAQTSTRLLQTLSSSGHVTPDEADDLRRLAEKRNALIHGELETEVTREDLERFTSVLATLRGLVPA